MPWNDTEQFFTLFAAVDELRVLCQFLQVTILTENTPKQLITVGPVSLTQPLDVIKSKVQALTS